MIWAVSNVFIKMQLSTGQRNAHQADIHQAGPMVNSEDQDEVPQKCSI